jgi:2-iminobutanoate/2-iminopropanoate deaminase
MQTVAPHYSPSVQWQNLVFVSGQLPLRPGEPREPSGDFETQVRQALQNVSDVLQAAGSSRDCVLKVTAFIVGVQRWDEFNRIYAEVFGPSRPARTVVPVAELHFGCLVEVDAIAYVRHA